MSQENVEQLVKRLEAAINRRDAEAVGALFQPEFEFQAALARAEGGIYRGVEGMRQFFLDVDSAWEDFRIELKEVREVGEQLFVRWRLTGASRSGIPLDAVSAQVWTWRDGVPWRVQSFTNVAEALEAVGLAE